MMRLLLLTALLFLSPLLGNGQNVTLGANGFIQSHPLTESPNYNLSTRMGVDLFELELGLRSFYSETPELQAYGVSLYSIIPIQKWDKIDFFGQVEGGFSFVFDESFGSERAFQMGLSPGIAYKFREYFAVELRLGYFVFANITVETPQITQKIIPSIGWSVRI